MSMSNSYAKGLDTYVGMPIGYVVGDAYLPLPVMKSSLLGVGGIYYSFLWNL